MLPLKTALFFLTILTDFEMEVHHLQHPFPAATVGFLAHILCNYPSHPQVSSTKISAGSEAPRRSCDFWPFCACLLAACCLLLNLVCPPLDP